MKGAIIIPTFYKKRHDQGELSMVSKTLFDRIKKDCGFSLIYTDTPDLKDLDIALIYAVPYHNRPTIPANLFDINGRLICYFGDLQCNGDEECEKNKELMFEKCDVIIGSYYEAFSRWYPQYLHTKYELFSGCFYPYERYANLQMNPEPEMKCLLSGSISRYYPFRQYIKELYEKNIDGISELIDVKRRSGALFKDYPKFLNGYFCAIATSGMYSAIVSKYFEIPAAGTLLLAERERELDMLGFEPYAHYVPITRENVIVQVKEVLHYPERYTKIRKDAMEFVRENHSDINRSLQFKDIVERLMK